MTTETTDSRKQVNACLQQNLNEKNKENQPKKPEYLHKCCMNCHHGFQIDGCTLNLMERALSTTFRCEKWEPAPIEEVEYHERSAREFFSYIMELKA
ncbi:MAG TPA: hypothetical protein O0X27_06255 [Methanocorpusculum sp.]|nr:hypothetical protein [Methanocorpusculum sp.]